jgi:hypothetical protein
VFFWILLGIAFVVFVSAVSWGAHGIGKRFHRPGTRRLD